jgi:hypothetical protein
MLIIALAGFSYQAPAEKLVKAIPTTLSLIALNDFQGNILPPVGSVLAPMLGDPAGVRVSAGGAAYLSTLVHQFGNGQILPRVQWFDR